MQCCGFGSEGSVSFSWIWNFFHGKYLNNLKNVKIKNKFAKINARVTSKM